MHNGLFSNCIFYPNPVILSRVMIMTDGYEILSSIIMATQTAQIDLPAAIEFVSSTTMKGALAEALQSYDCIESEALQLASQRGWDILSNQQLLCRLIRHVQIRFRRTDPAIAEYLILYYTRSMIQGLRISHNHETYDEQINRLFQKFLFSQSSCIRQMFPYL